MRLLYINNTLVDIDEETAIGVDFQAYDIKEPSKRKTNITNNFSIPKTAHNLALFGHPDNPQSTSDIPYDTLTCKYFIDNYPIILDGTVRIIDVTNRINLYVANKKTLWDDLKTFLWDDFMVEFMDWAENVKGLPIAQGGDNNFTTFLTNFKDATEGIKLPFYFGNLYQQNVLGVVEDKNKLIMCSIDEDYTGAIDIVGGGHFCIFIKTIFEFLEYKYSVNFCVSEVGITGNIWDDSIAPNIYTPARNIYTYPRTAMLGITGYELRYAKNIFDPLRDVEDKSDKSVHDCINAFMQKFNIVIDEISISGNKAYRLARFDDIETLADVVNFSDRISSVKSFKPSIDGYCQNNYVKAKALYPEANEMFFSRNVTCDNKNLDAKKDLFTIDEYVANFKSITSRIVPDLSIKESFKTFQFFLDDDTSLDLTDCELYYNYTDNLGVTTNMSATGQLYLKTPAHYSYSGEFVFLEKILEKPKAYTIEKWLKLSDIFNIEFFKQYYIQQLNGCYFINKISGFNPQKSNSPTTIELIRISSKTLTPTFPQSYYIDGLNNIFTDGNGNNFY